jgi:hypothetical protein
MLREELAMIEPPGQRLAAPLLRGWAHQHLFAVVLQVAHKCSKVQNSSQSAHCHKAAEHCDVYYGPIHSCTCLATLNQSLVQKSSLVPVWPCRAGTDMHLFTQMLTAFNQAASMD